MKEHALDRRPVPSPDAIRGYLVPRAGVKILSFEPLEDAVVSRPPSKEQALRHRPGCLRQTPAAATWSARPG